MDKQYSTEFRYHGLLQETPKPLTMDNDTSLSRDSEPVPAGVAIILHHGNRILLGKRTKLPMTGAWQLPGGWLRQDETVDHCLNRILAGFSSLELGGIRFQTYSDNHFDDGLRSISLYFSVACRNQLELEPAHNTLCSDWTWFDCYDLPEGLFLPLQQLVEKFDWSALDNHQKCG